jgi:hypothetical protein
LGGLAVLVVVALAVVITVLVVRPSSGGTTPTPTNAKSDFASANDTGPVNIITEDPTCEAWFKVVGEYSNSGKEVDWASRDFSLPASAWTAEQRTMYQTVGKAMVRAADQAVNLTKTTPHRVMRELYTQFIAYAQEFQKRIPAYVANDDNVAVETDTVATSLTGICSAIKYHSAQAVAPLISDPSPPSKVAGQEDSTEPGVFLAEPNSACSEWSTVVAQFSDAATTWQSIDPNIPARDWTPEQKTINAAINPIMSANADELERLGRKSENPIFEDFAILGAQYRRAFVVANATYTSADSYLAETATQLVRTIDWACKAAG